MIVTLPLARASHAAAALVGGKAASLGELMRAGHRVPDGFVITTTAFHRHIENADARGLLDGASPSAALLGELRNTPLAADITSQLYSAYDELVGNDPAARCAVRSSAVGEDGATLSFAGQHSTYYYVGRDELVAHVLDCWLSVWSSHARAYRASHAGAVPAM